MKIEDYCIIADGGLVLRESLQSYTRHNIITCDPTMTRQLDMLDRSRDTNLPLTIFGEPGCGKDNLAQYSHAVSTRKNKPFLKINCAYFPEGQIATELFGAGNKKASGLLQQAAGGSFYIENIQLLSNYNQYLLMKYITSSAGKCDDIRYMICLNNAKTTDRAQGLIEPLVSYFNSMTFNIPPLRKRPADILLLVLQQLHQIREAYQVERRISPNVMNAMLAYDWPGNNRQVINVIDRMVFMSNKTLIDSVPMFQNALSNHRQMTDMQEKTEQALKGKSLKEMVLDYEAMLIKQYIERYGSLRKAAAALNVAPSVLSSKLTRYAAIERE